MNSHLAYKLQGKQITFGIQLALHLEIMKISNFLIILVCSIYSKDEQDRPGFALQYVEISNNWTLGNIELEKSNLYQNWSEFEENLNDMVKYSDISKMVPPR